jgi:hypothetical protein
LQPAGNRSRSIVVELGPKRQASSGIALLGGLRHVDRVAEEGAIKNKDTFCPAGSQAIGKPAAIGA